MATYVFPHPYVPRSVHNPFKALVWLSEVNGSHDCRFSFYCRSLAGAKIHCSFLPLVMSGDYVVDKIKVIKSYHPVYVSESWTRE